MHVSDLNFLKTFGVVFQSVAESLLGQLGFSRDHLDWCSIQLLSQIDVDCRLGFVLSLFGGVLEWLQYGAISLLSQNFGIVAIDIGVWKELLEVTTNSI